MSITPELNAILIWVGICISAFIMILPTILQLRKERKQK